MKSNKKKWLGYIVVCDGLHFATCTKKRYAKNGYDLLTGFVAESTVFNGPVKIKRAFCSADKDVSRDVTNVLIWHGNRYSLED